MFPLNCCSRMISPAPLDLLHHYAAGRFPNWLNGSAGRVGWYTPTHRGIQWLDSITLPRTQRRYIDSERFTLQFNTAFRDVVLGCADLQREGKTWITPALINGYCELHRRGHAFSAEAWQHGHLAGGLFGIQIGGFISVESMYHHASHSSKFAYGQLLLRLRDRGFSVLDVNFVQPHFEQFGADWVPQWRFESILRDLLPQRLSLSDETPCPRLPMSICLALAAARGANAVMRRLKPRSAVIQPMHVPLPPLRPMPRRAA